MAALGKIVLYTMLILIATFATIIILILTVTFAGSSSDVQSSNTSPIANLGENRLLSCFMEADGAQNKFRQLSITWRRADLPGVVYKYSNGAEDLRDQESQYRGRTELFFDVLMQGNASLLLKDVRGSDDGEYTCTITSSEKGGSVYIHLRTAAFSAPTFKLLNGTVAAEASRWLPKPNVTWSDSGGGVLVGSTSFTQTTEGVYSLVSRLQLLNDSNRYTCTIRNNLVTAVSHATIKGLTVANSTYFLYSAAPSLPASSLSVTTAILCLYNLN